MPRIELGEIALKECAMNFLKLSLVATAMLASLIGAALAEDWSIKGPPPPGWRGEGVVKTPESSVPKPGDTGERAHTNTKIFVPTFPSPPNVQPGTGGSGQAPPPDATPPR